MFKKLNSILGLLLSILAVTFLGNFILDIYYHFDNQLIKWVKDGQAFIILNLMFLVIGVFLFLIIKQLLQYNLTITFKKGTK